MRFTLGMVILVIIAIIGLLVNYNWDCISKCMQRGGMYEQCVRQCGGYGDGGRDIGDSFG